MSYCTNYQGVQVCSNIPLNEKPQGPAHYKVTINFKVPFLSYIAWLDLQVALSFNNFVSELAKQLGYQPQISNYKVYVIDAYRIGIEFDASSPIPLIIAIVILAIAGAVIAYFIYQIIVEINQLFTGPSGQTLAKAVEYGSIALIIAVAGGVGYLIYKSISEERE
jgi:hypothetical protein